MQLGHWWSSSPSSSSKRMCRWGPTPTQTPTAGEAVASLATAAAACSESPAEHLTWQSPCLIKYVTWFQFAAFRRLHWAAGAPNPQASAANWRIGIFIWDIFDARQEQVRVIPPPKFLRCKLKVQRDVWT